MHVAVDAMGGDHAPGVVVEGAIEAARVPGLGVTLVGAERPVRGVLARFPDSSCLDIRVVVRRRRRRDGRSAGSGASPEALVVNWRGGRSLVAAGEAAALFSAGNTGATVLAARAALGLLDGAERPALAASIPTSAVWPCCWMSEPTRTAVPSTSRCSP